MSGYDKLPDFAPFDPTIQANQYVKFPEFKPPTKTNASILGHALEQIPKPLIPETPPARTDRSGRNSLEMTEYTLPEEVEITENHTVTKESEPDPYFNKADPNAHYVRLPDFQNAPAMRGRTYTDPENRPPIIPTDTQPRRAARGNSLPPMTTDQELLKNTFQAEQLRPPYATPTPRKMTGPLPQPPKEERKASPVIQVPEDEMGRPNITPAFTNPPPEGGVKQPAPTGYPHARPIKPEKEPATTTENQPPAPTGYPQARPIKPSAPLEDQKAPPAIPTARKENSTKYTESDMYKVALEKFTDKKLSTEDLIHLARENSNLPADNPIFKALKEAIDVRLTIETETKETTKKSNPFRRSKMMISNLAANRFGHGTVRKQLRALQKEYENKFHKEMEHLEKTFNSIDIKQKQLFFKKMNKISSELKEKNLPGGEVIHLSAQGDSFDFTTFLKDIRDPKTCGVNDNFSAPKESFIHTPTLIAFRNAIMQSIEESKHEGQELSEFQEILTEINSLIELANQTQAKQLESSYSTRLQAELASLDPEKLKNISTQGEAITTEWQVKDSNEHNKQQDLVAGHKELSSVFQGHVQGKSVLKEGEFSGDGAKIFQRGNVYASAVVDAAGNTENSAKATAAVLKIIEQEMDHLPQPPTPEKLQKFFMNIIQQGHIACKDLDRECTLSFNLYLPMENGKTMLVGFSLGDTFNVIRRAGGEMEVLTPNPEGKEETANGGGLGNITRFGDDREFDVYVRELNPGDEVGQMSDFGRDNYGYVEDRLSEGDSLMDAALNVREPPKNEELETRLEKLKERLNELKGVGDEYRKVLREYNSLSRELAHPKHPRTKKEHKMDDSAVVIFKTP